MVPWILASGSEHPFEISGSAPHFAVGRRHTGEIEAKIVMAPTVAVAANVNEVAGHAVFKG